MASEDQHKAEWEVAITQAFLPAYNRITGRKFVVARHGTRREPDVVCKDSQTGEQIGIEVTTGYYDAKHAKWVWDVVRGKETEEYMITRPDSEMNTRVLNEVAKRIREKAEKHYEFCERLLLLIRIHPWQFDFDFREKRLQTLPVPESHPFNEIYIESCFGRIYSLFPNRGLMLEASPRKRGKEG